MKYKVGDKVIIAGENSVCTITDVEPNKVNYPYRLENCRGEYNGWWDECDLHSAENLIDPEEATEQVTKDLESGVYDAPIGITPEMMGVTDAVVKGREYNKGYDDGVSDTEKNMKKALDRWYEKGLNEAWEAARKLLNIKQGQLCEVFPEKDYDNDDIGWVNDYTATEAIKMLKDYEKEQNAVKVGDEVKDPMGKICIVTNINDDDTARVMSKYDVLYPNGMTNRWPITTDSKQMVKTGRHFDAISEVLEQMKDKKPLTDDEVAKLMAGV